MESCDQILFITVGSGTSIRTWGFNKLVKLEFSQSSSKSVQLYLQDIPRCFSPTLLLSSCTFWASLSLVRTSTADSRPPCSTLGPLHWSISRKTLRKIILKLLRDQANIPAQNSLMASYYWVSQKVRSSFSKELFGQPNIVKRESIVLLAQKTLWALAPGSLPCHLLPFSPSSHWPPSSSLNSPGTCLACSRLLHFVFSARPHFSFTQMRLLNKAFTDHPHLQQQLPFHLHCPLHHLPYFSS